MDLTSHDRALKKASKKLDSDDGRIKSLPQDVVSQIKSSIAITSLTDVILGLVKNSLDASATKIEIAVNHARGGCTVEDDGTGIYPADFAESGGLGKMHHTSKVGIDSVHGNHGVFLASLCAMSLLTVISRHQRYRQCNSITFHRSRLVSRLIPCLEHQEIHGLGHGTRVLVRDLFGNFPVRVKQRANIPDAGIERSLNELKLALISLLLTWEPEVNLKLVNEENGQTILNLRHNSSRQYVKGSIDSPSKLPWLLTQGGFVAPGSQYKWIPASASTSNVKIKGVIALEPAPMRHLQFLSIGIDPLDKSTGTDLYDFINQRFKNSRFGVLDDDDVIGSEIISNRYEIRPKDVKPVKRGVERWPMYDLRISFSSHAVMTGKAVVGEQRTLEKILKVLDALVTNWLSAHYFVTTLSKADESKRVSSPVQASQKVKTPAKVSSSPLTERMRPHKLLYSQRNDPPTIEHQSLENASFDIGTEQKNQVATLQMEARNLSSDSQKNIQDFSPSPRQKHGIDEIESPSNKRARSSSNRLTLRSDINPNLGKPIPWIDSLLEKWQNPVFQITEPGIRRTYEETERNWCGETRVHMPSTPEGISPSGDSRLTKTSLEKAKFVGQVDNQFILIEVKDEKGLEVLVAVDQHAADERCKVEQLFAEFFRRPGPEASVKNNLGITSSVNCTMLNEPLNFELTPKELDHFRERAKKFADWGILFDIENANKSLNQGGKLVVKGLPPTISARASGDPQLLITMLRTELWKMVEHGQPASDLLEETKGSNHEWLRKIGRCPKGIVEMLNSRACRTAIMFNDPLTEHECKMLIESLAKCAFPFQCAHGRPSMVPLIHIGKIGVGLGQHVEEKPFVEAFDAWKKRCQENS